MLYKTIFVPVDLIICNLKSMSRTLGDMQLGKTSYSKGTPLCVFYIKEGEFQGKFILKDGYHRLFEQLLTGSSDVEVYVDEEGLFSDCLYKVEEIFKIDASLKYGGLEGLAEEEKLKEIFNFL